MRLKKANSNTPSIFDEHIEALQEANHTFHEVEAAINVHARLQTAQAIVADLEGGGDTALLISVFEALGAEEYALSGITSTD
ncbi:hypothetical protein [Pseudomonas delhiensis]|uniref:hypothetical protein n=1 Tax=Pseudomonas delhiensis TaxID=366289 RepID=UPI00315B1B31